MDFLALEKSTNESDVWARRLGKQLFMRGYHPSYYWCMEWGARTVRAIRNPANYNLALYAREIGKVGIAIPTAPLSFLAAPIAAALSFLVPGSSVILSQGLKLMPDANVQGNITTVDIKNQPDIFPYSAQAIEAAEYQIFKNNLPDEQYARALAETKAVPTEHNKWLSFPDRLKRERMSTIETQAREAAQESATAARKNYLLYAAIGAGLLLLLFIFKNRK